MVMEMIQHREMYLLFGKAVRKKRSREALRRDGKTSWGAHSGAGAAAAAVFASARRAALPSLYMQIA